MSNVYVHLKFSSFTLFQLVFILFYAAILILHVFSFSGKSFHSKFQIFVRFILAKIDFSNKIKEIQKREKFAHVYY